MAAAKIPLTVSRTSRRPIQRQNITPSSLSRRVEENRPAFKTLIQATASTISRHGLGKEKFAKIERELTKTGKMTGPRPHIHYRTWPESELDDELITLAFLGRFKIFKY